MGQGHSYSSIVYQRHDAHAWFGRHFCKSNDILDTKRCKLFDKKHLIMSTQPQQNRAISKGDPDEIFGIIQPLGEGAFGMVYKAVDNRDGELVAVKIMPVEAEMGNMEREIYLLKSCHSPYIVNFRGAYIKDEMIWIAMEYCGAGSVLDLMKVTGKKLCVFLS